MLLTQAGADKTPAPRRHPDPDASCSLHAKFLRFSLFLVTRVGSYYDVLISAYTSSICLRLANLHHPKSLRPTLLPLRLAFPSRDAGPPSQDVGGGGRVALSDMSPDKHLLPPLLSLSWGLNRSRQNLQISFLFLPAVGSGHE